VLLSRHELVSLKAVFESSAFLLVACGAYNQELKRANTAGAAALDCPATASEATLLRDRGSSREYAVDCELTTILITCNDVQGCFPTISRQDRRRLGVP